MIGLLALVGHLENTVRELEHIRRTGLEKAAVLIENDAKDSLGTYQDGWPQLADSTQLQRLKDGYSPDEPLLRSRTLHDAITHEVVSDMRAIIGVPNDTGEVEPDGTLVSEVAKDMEWGTFRSPPRPFMAPAAARKGEEAAKLVAGELHIRLKGGQSDG